MSGTLHVLCTRCLDCCICQDRLSFFSYPYTFLVFLSFFIKTPNKTLILAYCPRPSLLRYTKQCIRYKRTVCPHCPYKHALRNRSGAIHHVNYSDLKESRGQSGYSLDWLYKLGPNIPGRLKPHHPRSLHFNWYECQTLNTYISTS